MAKRSGSVHQPGFGRRSLWQANPASAFVHRKADAFVSVLVPELHPEITAFLMGLANAGEAFELADGRVLALDARGGFGIERGSVGNMAHAAIASGSSGSAGML
ncbi:hypothetical protein GGR04_003747 [Aureimonas pseudogalii]|uniref:Uncharacterized protein n=1 Tax=Aureimonas pseudogalii TaxID=1744844 RepID=A0A7W6H761_9HYPH|nr:hypothetical protein [Aureimonas pseudogalii]